MYTDKDIMPSDNRMETEEAVNSTTDDAKKGETSGNKNQHVRLLKAPSNFDSDQCYSVLMEHCVAIAAENYCPDAEWRIVGGTGGMPLEPNG